MKMCGAGYQKAIQDSTPQPTDSKEGLVAYTQGLVDKKKRDDELTTLRNSPEFAAMSKDEQMAAVLDLERKFNAEDQAKAQGRPVEEIEADPNEPFSSKRKGAIGEKNMPQAPDLTDKAVHYARMAEARRVRGGRGRKSTFLTQYRKQNLSSELGSMPVSNDTALGG
jgi:hypothetical protein